MKSPFMFKEEIVKDPKKAVRRFLKESGRRDKDFLEKGKKYFGDEENLREFLHKFYLELAKQKIKESYSPDIIISHLINSVDEIDKIINTLYERVGEIYGLYRPEEFRKWQAKKMAETIMNEKGDSREGMGFDFDKPTLELLKEYAKEILNLIDLKENIIKNIEKKMDDFAKNLSTVLGPLLGAKMISIAGSLKNLANMPSSTIQVLGAEKALFRHLRKGTKPPKHGVIIQHPLVAKAKKNEKGRVSRAVAAKAAIAAKVDYYGGKFVGDKLLKEMEEKHEKNI